MIKIEPALSFFNYWCGLVLILAQSTNCLYGQGKDQVESPGTSNIFRLGIKLNSIFILDTYHNKYSIDLAPAIVLATKRNLFHEVELSKVSFSKLDQITDSHTDLDININYHFMHPLFNRYSKIIPQVGLSTLFLVIYDKTVPVNINGFRRSTTYFGGIFGVVSQIRYLTNKRFFFDLSLILNFIDIGYQTQRIENPSISLRQQRSGHFDSDYYFWNQIELKFGLGLRI